MPQKATEDFLITELSQLFVLTVQINIAMIIIPIFLNVLKLMPMSIFRQGNT